MKTFILLAVVVLCSFMPVQKAKLKGSYKVEFDKKYAQQGYQINFNENTYMQVMPDAVTYKGTITYEKFRAMIRKNKDDNPIEIDNREIGKDTIRFSTKSNRDLSLTVSRGKMIRLK